MPAGMSLRDKEIMEKLFDLKKLSTTDIAFVLGCSVQVVTRRKREYETKGTITAVKEMSWQKIKPEHREVLMKIVEEHGENKSLQQLSDYLAEATGIRVTTVTISRMLKAETAAKGQARRKIRAPRADVGTPRRRHDESQEAPRSAPEAEREVPVCQNNLAQQQQQQQQQPVAWHLAPADSEGQAPARAPEPYSAPQAVSQPNEEQQVQSQQLAGGISSTETPSQG